MVDGSMLAYTCQIGMMTDCVPRVASWPSTGVHSEASTTMSHNSSAFMILKFLKAQRKSRFTQLLQAMDLEKTPLIVLSSVITSTVTS